MSVQQILQQYQLYANICILFPHVSTSFNLTVVTAIPFHATGPKNPQCRFAKNRFIFYCIPPPLFYSKSHPNNSSFIYKCSTDKFHPEYDRQSTQPPHQSVSNQRIIINMNGANTSAYIVPSLPLQRNNNSFLSSSPTVSPTTKPVRPRHTRHVHSPAVCVSAPPRPTETIVPTDTTVIVPTDTDTQPSVQLAEKSGAGGDDYGLPLEFDEPIIEAYWNARPTASFKRLSEVTLKFTPWIMRIALDTQRNTLSENSGRRAAELRQILSDLGPTFIKLGQALSVRPDLIGPNAMAELRSLCDAVPSFSNSVAFAMMEEELGQSVTAVYSEISDKPIAAASLGQVYKAKLRSTGEQVAVKVQRPDMLKKVSLDLYCLKRVAKLAQTVQNSYTASKTDYLSLLSRWAVGTYQELDYLNEAQNSRKFASLVQARMPEVYVPKVYDQFTSRKVLTMEWIDGVKLAECEPEEIKALVSKGVECFLFQLLSAGFFHSDPHPGNLMRLNNGQLCVIDFGLMASIDKSEMDSMVSAIVHLANRDWPRVVDDFVALKFLPTDIDKGKVEPVIGAILDQALEGGGAKSINFQSLSDELAAVTFDFPFSIPPAFALLLRALSVLEGIALVGDPEFKLIMEAFPFVSKLVMTDRSPALGEALTQILYKDGTFSPTRLRVLVDSSQGIVNEGDAFVDFDTPSTQSKVTKDAVDFLFSKDGLIIREILVDEIAKGIDVLVRDSYHRVSSSFQQAIPAPLRPLTRMMPLSSLSNNSANSLLPIPSLFAADKFFALPPVTDEDRVYLANVRELMEWLLSDGLNGEGMSPSNMTALLPEILEKCTIIGGQVTGKLGEKVIERFYNDLLRSGGEVVGNRQRVPGFPSR